MLQLMLILVAPVFISATIYVNLGRLKEALLGHQRRKCSPTVSHSHGYHRLLHTNRRFTCTSYCKPKDHGNWRPCCLGRSTFPALRYGRLLCSRHAISAGYAEGNDLFTALGTLCLDPDHLGGCYLGAKSGEGNGIR
ncbi:hypothetical protein CCUS01_17096 [Colletotrichum cuscutae]|uniref:Uncharacterized protein n=1 Tax=Colletotrichum cuscutae TaxID=1209917 RepID=A0AAI9VCR1_9PEZI|nr:hypothetical protein CCUS01_17096 [Colletotrichum cuscutae]